MKLRTLRFLIPSAAAILSGTMLGTALGLGAAPAALADTTPIVFAAGPDDTGTVRRLVDSFNAIHAGKIEVTWQEMDRDNNVHHDKLVSGFTAETDAPHVIASDVIWTAEFAKNGWVEDLTKRFYDTYERAEFLQPALASATHRLRIWGVPWYTDTSILFYRKDLLAESGYNAPPETWDQFVEMARKVMKDSGVRYGFIFQGAEYEGGTANAAEFIWSAGGGVMRGDLTVTGMVHSAVVETDHVMIASKESAAGLNAARHLIAEGIAPVEVTMFREQQALDAFLAGNAVFLRSWPYVRGMLRRSTLTEAQVGVSALPGVSAEHAGHSCLGGWNLMLNAQAGKEQQAAAVEFIQFLTAPEQQKRLALEAELLPVIERLYHDPEVAARVPIATLARELMASARVRGRPRSPFYAEVSSEIASVFQRVLKGEISGAEAVVTLDEDLRAILIRNR